MNAVTSISGTLRLAQDTQYGATVAEASMPASCGELVQGLLDGRRVLVSCPIDRRVRVRVRLRPGGDGRIAGLAAAPKAARALRAVMDQYATADINAEVRIIDPLPRGKGLASSTADVAGVIAAGLHALGRAVDPADVSRMATEIEPSDSTALPGLNLFDYHHGMAIKPLGPPPALRILMLDWGGRIDSVAFNRRAHRPLLEKNSARFGEAVELLTSGLREGEPDRIGQAASLSAELHQAVLPRPWLAPSLAFCRRLGGYGVTLAHSGTLSGILLPDDAERIADALDRAWRELPGVRAATACRLVSGGVQLTERAAGLSANMS